jgi:hypothetical protein
MKNKSFTFAPIFLLVFAALACNSRAATPTSAPIAPEIESQEPPFAGMWMSGTETLVFTRTSLYRVQSNPEIGQVNEQFAEIILYDPINSHISLRIQWIKVNGTSVGFDAPVYSLSYKIDGDVLQIGLGTESEFTSELSPTIYYRK